MDQVDSTTLTVDADGSFQSEVWYLAYSEVRYAYGTTVPDKLYTGQQETEIGLDYYIARFYDPVIAHFISADTKMSKEGGAKSHDRSSYVNNNPINNNDLAGHCFGPLLPICIAVGAFIVDNAVIMTGVAATGAILSMVGLSNPDPLLINDREASKKAFEGSLILSGVFLRFGTGLIDFSSYYYHVKTIASISNRSTSIGSPEQVAKK